MRGGHGVMTADSGPAPPSLRNGTKPGSAEGLRGFAAGVTAVSEIGVHRDRLGSLTPALVDDYVKVMRGSGKTPIQARRPPLAGSA